VSLLDRLLLDGSEVRLEFELQPMRLEGGHSAELYRFRLATGPGELRGRDLVLRLASPRTANAEEPVIQSCLAKLGYPAPEVVRSGLIDDSQLFLIMAYVEGKSLFHAQSPLAAFQRVPPLLAELMIALHGLDSEPVRQSLAEQGLSTAADAQERARADVERCLTAVQHPARHRLRQWFDAHRPDAAREVVCHGDLHALNVLVDGGLAVIDWELAALGEPAFDIARTKLLLHAVPMDLPRIARPLIHRLGRRAASQFERAYVARSPVPKEAIRWYEALHTARMAGLILAAGDVAEPDDAVVSAWRPTLPLLAASLKRRTGVDIAL
jgi:aminoglycoside phosphotransferase (APT) family kinase protein